MWQRIETAPKDGTRVLLGGGDMFCEAMDRRVFDPLSAQWYEEEWLVGGAESGYVRLTVNSPTHWMLLPEAPQP